MKLYSQAELEALSHEAYRARFKGQPPAKIINLGPALALDEPDTLQWRGAEFPVRLISYREGVRLQRTALELQRLEKEPFDTDEALAALEKFADDTLALFHSFLDPKPIANPFLDATPQEVGSLLGFFLLCLMRQSARTWVATGRPQLSTT